MAQKNGENGLPLGSGLYWKGNIIYTAFYHDGKKYVFSTATNDVKEALQVRDSKKSDLAKGEHMVVVKGVRMNDLFDDYIAHLEEKEIESGAYMSRQYEKTSYKASTCINKHLRPLVGTFKPEEITEETLKTWKAKRLKNGTSISTTNSVFRFLKATLRRATECRPRRANPLDMPSFKELINIKAEKQRARTGVIKLEQYRQIMAELADHLKPFFATAYWTGAREKELKFARRSNLKWNEKKLYLNPSETKPGQFRICGVNDELLAVLKEWEERTAKEHRTTPWLFHFEGQQLGEIKTGWNAALKRCGLRVMVMNDEGTAKTKIVNGKKKHVWKNLVMFHDARRSMNTILEDNDVDERDRMSQSGHLTPDQSRKYSQSKRAADRVMQAQNKVIAEEKGQKPMAVAPRAGEGANSVLATIERLTVLLEQGKISPERFELLTAKIA